MLNDFISGGQVFLHKVRMFWQVFTRTIHIAFLVGIIAAGLIYTTELKQLDWQAFYSYRKAVLANDFDGAMNKIRASIGNKPSHITFVKAQTKKKLFDVKADPKKVIRSYVFRHTNNIAMDLFQRILIWTGFITLSTFALIVLVWTDLVKT